MIQLEIRGHQKNYLTVDEKSTVTKVKSAISTLLNLPASEILLYNGGTPLNDDQCVDALPTFVLDLSIPLLGGKVHGSLARAGKVKGQTPKVEKQDKKKKKTGRAKRRMQYNRRFVNVVQTFGRRKGPNANS
ncbi:hypothetical protein V9T40_006751 [Parthenolecanium corni]|uniref:Ubiquitin-like domain-containing protein n=1 Tax=Parthenolecanium corni TaxID=536013 RepID=A0AAN9Y9K0_9HEMI